MDGKICRWVETTNTKRKGKTMTAEQNQILQECSKASFDGKWTFPEIVGRLSAAGIERYHADYCRQEKTYYLPSGDSLVVALPHERHEIATDFSPSAVEAAVRQSQRNEHTYTDF